MKSVESLNRLFDKYEPLTEGLFHNTLWQLMINGVRDNVQSAFVYVYGQAEDKVNVGIVDLNEWGYTPATFSIKNSVPELQRENFIDELNHEVFGISPKRAFELQLISMRN